MKFLNVFQPNPDLFQIFLDHNETDNDTHDSHNKLQNDILLTRISDLDNQMQENNEKFVDML